jgi:hypothetical protein
MACIAEATTGFPNSNGHIPFECATIVGRATGRQPSRAHARAREVDDLLLTRQIHPRTGLRMGARRERVEGVGPPGPCCASRGLPSGPCGPGTCSHSLARTRAR